MMYNLKNLMDNKIQAIDGEIGRLDDFYFDDRSWSIRYLVVNTGNWIEGKKVLLSPVVIQKPDNKQVTVKLTKDQIKNSPDIDTKKPVSRQNETDNSQFYQWPIYGLGVLTTPMFVEKETNWTNKMKGDVDPHLRSTDDVIGYNLRALDDEIGHIEDMVVDDETWSIQYLIVSTKNWMPGKKVIISSQWINHISWEDKKVYVDRTVDSIKNSPEYDSSKPWQSEYEMELNNYYGTLINK